MFEGITITDILDLGTSGLLVLFLWKLWERLTHVTDRLLELAEQAQAERLVIARMNGLETQDLKHDAAIILQNLRGKRG